MNSTKKTIHLVPSTHWDREWYQPLLAFKLAFANVIEQVISKLENSELEFFHLDGQSCLLEDLHDLRPDLYKRLTALTQTGKVETGPLYIQSDMFIPSGESFFRNIEIGSAIARESGNCSSVIYAADAFGHSSDLPAILNSAGFNNYFFSRGLGEHLEPLKTEFIWESENSLYKLFTVAAIIDLFDPPGDVNGKWLGGSYALAMDLPLEQEYLKKFFTAMLEDYKKYSQCENLLAMNGGDHHLPQNRLPDVLDICRKSFKQLDFCQNSLTNYFKSVREEYEGEQLLSVSGELTDGRILWILSATASSRIYLKQLNKRAQDTLEGLIEPWFAVSPPELQAEFANVLHESWKMLLQNQAHDSICGCSVDAVHREMLVRYDRIEQFVACFKKRILRYLAGNQKHEYKLPPDNADEFSACLYSSACGGTNGLCIVELSIPVNISLGDYIISVNDELYNFIVIDEGLPGTANGPFVNYGPEFKIMHEVRIVIDRLKLAEMSSKSLEFIRKDLVKIPEILNAEPVLKLVDGQLHFQHNKTDLKNLIYFEDEVDCGDTYFFKAEDKVNRKYSTEYRLLKSELCGNIQIMELETDIQLQKSMNNKEILLIPLKLYLVADCSSGRIDVKVYFNNISCDHRLRVCINIGESGEKYWKGNQFGASQQEFSDDLDSSNWKEPRPATKRNYSWISAGKLTVAPSGLHEYEIESQYLKLTLLRSVGMLSRYGAGPEIATPEAQCQGQSYGEFSIYPEIYNTENNHIERIARSCYRRHYGIVIYGKNKSSSFGNKNILNFKSDTLVISAFYRETYSNKTLIRIFNPCQISGTGSILSSRIAPIAKKVVYKHGKPEEKNDIGLNNLQLKPGEIITISVKLISER